MKKIEWLIAILFIGMGLTCMTIPALSFQSNSLMHFGGYIKTFLICAVLLIAFIILLANWIRMRKKR
ncbi:hypothetical protein SAMN04487895_1248 [Paenibacillus sophorae]|uniref:Uncharacterized protein n=1 Tax=Paenibacillus sophorae TaxID=1333845 RepID=A0A1H8VG49_9BACL|nr:hypothetical protein [Paenibacillus sophorae]QWU15402.1 hypothetical protein KP014_26600 [Paenibacillus sophorae]SEP14361.1 hypothetical protein SAMN04487895_1248 [Paenibacillus sophorae]